MSVNTILRRAGGESIDGTQDDGVIPETIHRFSVTGVATANRFDQVPFYSLNGDVALSANHDLVTPVNVDSDWSNSALWQWTAHHPAPLVNVHLIGWNNDALTTAEVQTQKVSPDGKDKNKRYPLGRFRSAQDFQTNVMSIPIGGLKLDGYQIFRLILLGNATPNKGSIQFTLAATRNPLAAVPYAAGRVLTPIA